MSIKVTLISAPENIDDTLDLIWQISKTNAELNRKKVIDIDLLARLMSEDVPVLRHFYFTFLLENMSISFREQLVRSQHDHFWIQSGRITDWTEYAYDINDTIRRIPELRDLALKAHGHIREFIKVAAKSGINPEDYRDLVPVGAHHRGVWTVNIQSLISRFRKRTCWVAQNGLWFPVLSQVAEQLRDYHQAFSNMARPPCRDRNWKWTGCTINETMMDRYSGTDPLPLCPSWMAHAKLFIEPEFIAVERTSDRAQEYERLWGHGMLD